MPVAGDNRSFFEAVRGTIGDAGLGAAILLVGANDDRALAIRRSQAALRYDRLASYWSHAALLVDAGGKGVPRGLEISLEPANARRHTPGRNGVTTFGVERYFDAARYPNLGLFCLQVPRGSNARTTILDAALSPNRDRTRYPFWDQLAVWARYTYAPDYTPNPLTEGVAVPSAALCEYAYGAAQIDLTPGATGNHACPEILWATMKRWSPQLEAADHVSFRAFTLLRDPSGTPSPPPPDLREELGLTAAEPERGAPRRTRKAPAKSKR